jgi:tRNA (guanosine-2'-O-)-methyltransferase
MKRLGPKSRNKRLAAEHAEFMESANRVAPDPGLRDVYDALPRLPVRVICSPMGKSVNHGGIIRLAEAFRIEHVSFANELDDTADFAGAKGTRRWMPFGFQEPEAAAQQARGDGYRVYAVTLSERSVPIHKVDWQLPAAVVLGREKEGVSDAIRDMADEHIAIPMYGMIESLNVTQACGLTLWEIAKATEEHEPARGISRRLMGLGALDLAELQRTMPSDEEEPE